MEVVTQSCTEEAQSCTDEGRLSNLGRAINGETAGTKQTSVPFVVLRALRDLKKTEGFLTSPATSKTPQVLTNFLIFAA